MDIVGKRIKELREGMGVTKTELARQLRTSHANVVNWENGKRVPGADSIVRLCKFFGCTSDFLLGLGD